MRWLLAFGAFLLAANAQAEDLCAGPWQSHFAPGTSCVATGNGAVIAPPGEAATLASVIDEAAVRYAAAFAAPPRPIAVIAGGSLTAAQGAYLRAHGYIAFPWISAAQRRTLAEGAIRGQIAKQRPGLTPEQRDAAVAQAMAQRANDAGGARERGSLAHELGHLWFRAMFDQGTQSEGAQPRYGSDAPDWIDEMAAVLAENDALTEQRRAALAPYARASGAEGFYPLAEYLTMEHPVLAGAAALQQAGKAPGGGGGGRVMVLSGADAQKLIGTNTPIRFYVQSRGFADFLIAQSGDPRIFNTIAKALAGGETFAAWLARDGARHRLPAQLAALDTAWQTWLRAH